MLFYHYKNTIGKLLLKCQYYKLYNLICIDMLMLWVFKGLWGINIPVIPSPANKYYNPFIAVKFLVSFVETPASTNKIDISLCEQKVVSNINISL